MISSMSSPTLKRHSTERPCSQNSGGLLRPNAAAGRRYSEFRISQTSQTSSLHTALSELAGDVEVVDIEDGALNPRYSCNGYQGGSFFYYKILSSCRKVPKLIVKMMFT